MLPYYARAPPRHTELEFSMASSYDSIVAEIDTLLDRRLMSSVSHEGVQTFTKRYVNNGHQGRLAQAYARIVASGQAMNDVCVVGASPVEALILSEMLPHCSVRLFGSPESIHYFSRDNYRFTRTLDESLGGAWYSVQRHNLEGSLPEDDQSFDVVICLEVLEHIRRDPLAAMVEMRRVLRPQGRLFLSTPNANAFRSIVRALEWENPMFFPCFGPPPTGIIHAHEYSALELVALCGRSGFFASSLTSFDHSPTATFSHDTAYRSGALVDGETRERLGLRSGEYTQLIESLKREPLRGDYLFVEAVPGESAESKPYEPLYCLFE